MSEVKQERHERAEAIIGECQKLLTNLLYWIEHGQSETAAKAIRSAQDNGWSRLGWRDYCRAAYDAARDKALAGK